MDSEELEEYEEDMVYKEIDEQCLICGQDYRLPTLLPCGHIFCDRCAIENFKSNRSCFKCGKISDGIFNDGTKLLKKAMEERTKFKNRVKVKKNKFGSASSYLVGIQYVPGARRRFEEEEANDESAVVVPLEKVQQALNRSGTF